MAPMSAESPVRFVRAFLTKVHSADAVMRNELPGVVSREAIEFLREHLLDIANQLADEHAVDRGAAEALFAWVVHSVPINGRTIVGWERHFAGNVRS